MMVMVIFGKKITKQLGYKLFGIFIVAAFILGVVVYFGLIWREKQQFATAEKEIDSLHAQIVEKIGKPDQEKKEKSCGYASREFGRGPRSCFISYHLLYSDSSSDNSNNIMFKTSGIVGTNLRNVLIKKPSQAFTQYVNGGPDQDFEQNMNSKTYLNCTVSYTYPVLPWDTAPIKPSSKESLLVTVDCAGPAKAEYFPVDKK